MWNPKAPRVPCCTSWLTVEPSASGAPGRERTQDAGRCILHICMFYVSVHSAFAPLPHPPQVLSLSSASFPASLSFRPPFLRDVYRASFLLIKSRPPRLPPFVFSIFSSVPPALRESRGGDGVNELGKANARTEKGEPKGGKRVTI